tara:strand:- start:906 stop:2021 length:1116 start_codon:yes stop_codon:yes gene_type:complete
MSSQIIDTNPTAGTATTQSVRDNFGFAKKEINDLQKMSTMFNRTEGDGSTYTLTLTDQFQTNALVDGARITVEINTISTSPTPTLRVTAGGTDTGAKTIVKAGLAGGSALVAGDLKEDAIVDLVYVASSGPGIEDKWVWLNCVSESANLTSANLTSPNLTSPTIAAGALSGDFSGNPNFTGAPTSTTAAAGTNTTQIATTAFALANSSLQVAGQFRLFSSVNGFSSGDNFIGNGSNTGSFVEATGSVSYSRIGSAITNTLGKFTFPETGVYLVVYQTSHIIGTNEVNIFNTIEVSINGSAGNFIPVSEHQLGNTGTQTRASGVCFALVDVGDISNVVVRFKLKDVTRTVTSLEGSNVVTLTGATFIKLAVT